MSKPGIWNCEYYGSGTMIVTSRSPGVPHFYIYGPTHPTESIRQQNRQKICIEIRDYMNGGERPLWLDDLTRVSEITAEDVDGTSIQITGPHVWDEMSGGPILDESQEASDDRARLMDKLLSTPHAVNPSPLSP